MEDIRNIRRKHTSRFKWLYLLIVAVPALALIPTLYDTMDPAIGTQRSVRDSMEPFFAPKFNKFKNPYTAFDPKVFLNFAIKERNREKISDSNRFYLNRAKAHRNAYMPIIMAAANEYRVDPATILAIIKAESNYDPKAISRAGAVGLMQLMPETAKDLGVNDRFNPEQNIHGGVKYFSQLLKKFRGNHALALAAYNAGMQKVLKYRGIPPYTETIQYVNKVFRFRKKYLQEIMGG